MYWAISGRETTARSLRDSARINCCRRYNRTTESMNVRGARRRSTGTSSSPVSAWRVKATCWSRSRTKREKSSESRRQMTASSRISTGQSSACRRPSRYGPVSSCTNTRRVSRGRSPRSLLNSEFSTCVLSATGNSAELMQTLLHEINHRNFRASSLTVIAVPCHLLMAPGLHAVSASQRNVADNAAESLFGREPVQNVGNRSRRAVAPHGTQVCPDGPEIDLRLRHQLADRIQPDGRPLAFRHATRERVKRRIE